MLHRSSRTIKRIDCVRVLGRGTRSKSKRHSPSAILLGRSTNMPATRLKRRTRTAQSKLTQGLLHTFGKTITDYCLASRMFSPLQEKGWNWLKRQRIIISILLEFLLPRDMVLESYIWMADGSLSECGNFHEP